MTTALINPEEALRFLRPSRDQRTSLLKKCWSRSMSRRRCTWMPTSHTASGSLIQRGDVAHAHPDAARCQR